MTGEAYIVHQGIFLGDEKAINRVYPEAVRAALAKICALKETVYTKAAVLDAPERLADTAYIFSTWGMPAFTEREIETCFPKLRAVFYAAGTVQAFARPFPARFLRERPDCTAVLDVTVEEPLPPAHPLCALDNCFLTTHIAGSAGQEVWRMAAYMLGELQRLEAGAPTRYGVTTAMLETMA